MSVSISFELSSRPRRSGSYLISVRLTENRLHTRISTGYEVESKKHWDANRQVITIGHSRRPAYLDEEVWLEQLSAVEQRNHALRLIKSKLLGLMAEYHLKNGVLPSKEVLKDLYIGRRQVGVRQYYQEVKEKQGIRGRRGLTVSEATYAKYNVVIGKICQFEGTKNPSTGELDVPMARIDVSFLNRFTADCLGKGMKATSVRSHLSTLRALMERARKENLINNDPWPLFDMPQRDTEKTTFRLSREQFQNIANYPDANKWRLGFLLMCLTGLRISDVLKLRWEDVSKDRIYVKAQKTGKRIEIPITAHLSKVLDQARKFIGKNSYVIPFYCNDEEPQLLKRKSSGTTLSNKYLRSLSKRLDIKPTLSNKSARDAFAAFAQDADCSGELIADMLQHSSRSLTKDYSGAHTFKRLLEGYSKTHAYLYAELPNNL